MGVIDGGGMKLDPRILAMGVKGRVMPGAHATFVLGEIAGREKAENGELIGMCA